MSRLPHQFPLCQRLGMPILAAAIVLLAAPAVAQLGRSHPGPGYFTALDEIHAGEFRRAERGMRNEIRTAVKTIDSRWIDSIIYATGHGEALYQQGRLREALAEFDAAIDQFLAEADWLRRLKFQQKPREDTAIPRRLPGWARVSRPIAYANMPRSFLYGFGQVNNSQAYQQGGVVQQAQFWKLDAEELARSIAWNLYRRGQLLGPLGAYDKRTSAVVNRLAGGGLGPANHWSGAWVELWWGLAAAAAGDAIGAQPHLQNSLKLGGRFDHRLSGLAWLTLGRLAAGAGDSPNATLALREAISAAVAYDDIDVLVEATLAWHAANQTVPGTPPPLAEVVGWSERRGHWLASAAARLALAENDASVDVRQAFRRGRDLSRGLLGRESDRLQALAAARNGSGKTARQLARQALENQATMSRRRLQVAIASDWFDSGRLSPRLARQAFGEVLGDPGAFAWANTPLDALSWMAAPETVAFDRWFATAVDRKDALLAIRVLDAQRRREFFAGQPLAGRLTAVRWLLEAPTERLPKFAIAPRARVERMAPQYRDLRRDGGVASTAVRAELAVVEDSITPALKKATDAFTKSVSARERVVLQLALSRAPTPLVFPPSINAAAAKQRLKQGEAVLAFHDWRGELYGVVLTAGGEHLWRIGKTERVAQLVERLLRETAGKSQRQSWTLEDLHVEAWQEPAAELGTLLLGDSRLEGSMLERLWIVPDGPLWRAPLALLPVPGETDEKTRLGETMVTYAPTPGWAARERSVLPELDGELPVWRVVAGVRDPLEWEGPDPFAEVAKATAPPRAFDTSASLLKLATSQAIFDAAAKRASEDPLGLPITTASEGQREIAAWSRLPYGGPSAVALANLSGGEAGGARPGRSGQNPLIGAPELHLIGSLLAGGTPTVLLERWPTRGVRSRDLVAEWLNGMSRLPTEAAWARSLSLGRDAPLDPAREPRLDLQPTESVTGEHPFWWSGFLLID